jgi:hypothetical protein
MKLKSLLTVLVAGVIYLPFMSYGAVTLNPAVSRACDWPFDAAFGADVPRDFEKAMKACLPAAERGDAEAQYKLGVCYSTVGNDRYSLKEALKWLILADEQGYEEALPLIKVICSGDFYPRDNKDASSLVYSSDIADMYTFPKITGIGNVGRLQTIIDLRSFIPLSSVSRQRIQNCSLFELPFKDVHLWFQIPIKFGIRLIYYGEGENCSAGKLSETKVLREDELAGDDLKWAKFSYELARSSGKELFKSAGGRLNCDAAEPVAVILTSQSAIVIMNFKFTNILRPNSTGQLLCGYEFSRTTREYKTFYSIYQNTLLGRAATDAFVLSGPYVIKALSICFGSYGK